MIDRLNTRFVAKLMKEFPAVALIGPRQCGKTTMAKIYQRSIKRKTIYFDLESPADFKKLHDPELLLKQHENECVIIDEVQRMPELFPLLRHLIDSHRKPGRFLLLGSASPEMIKHASESLAGRIFYQEVNPLNISELPDKKNTINKHRFRGGFPEAWLSKSNESFTRWMDGFVRTFIECDLNQMFGVMFSPVLMIRLWRMLAHYHGGIWNAHSFAKGLDVSPTTVNRYLDYLEAAFVIRRLPSFHYNMKKRIVKAPKVYIRDSGIVNYLLDISDENALHYHSATGFLWEGYVIEQILQLLPRKIQPYFYRTHDGSETDLVLVKGVKPEVSIEIKNTSSPSVTRGMTESIHDLNTKQNFMIVPGENVNYPIKNNIIVCDLLTFQLNFLPKISKN